MILLRLALITLFVYRLAWEIAVKPGPGDLFSNFRRLVSTKYMLRWQEDFVICPVCWSFVLAFVFVPVFMPWTGVRDWILYSGAVSGAILIIHFWLWSKHG